LLLDEDQEETDAQQEALLPTISAGKSQNQQTIRVGTPPSGGSAGVVFMRIRKMVLDGKDPDTCWQEWSVETIRDPNDEDAWYEANPSLGYFLMLRAVKNEAKKMAVDSFNKMRLGWVAGVENMRAISDEQWTPLAVKHVTIPDMPSLVYAVKFAPDGSAVTLSVGLNMPSGKVHVELIERKPMSAGHMWIVDWLMRENRWRKCSKIIIDGQAGTTLLVEELVRTERRMSKKILTPNAKEAGAAFGGFYNAIEKQELTHFDQPALNLSIRTVKKRSIGKDGMYGFASMNTDIQSDPTESVALAHYGAKRFKKSTSASGSGQSVMV
jgi:phage terminase large subunit-like protein